ncbi:MAG TPA: sigma-70 family RNA polymerase sigma factor [Streptosporangiaceae bacterium]|jgi:RNA polymerase sigma-70 factor, ECF subfamily|nr:sigma-70 family RNA polymerase sigma factor [Streptosporangiaceae bacterium]
MTQADDVTYTDADLVALLRAGDEPAISRLVEQWSPTMLRLARSFVDSAQSAEDVVQEAWLGMLSGLARFEGRSSLRTWTFTILVNRARTRGARDARTLPRSPLEDGTEETAQPWFCVATDITPESAVLSSEILIQLDRAISALPSRQRQVVTMREIEGMSAEEVCAALGISAANQRVLLHRARVALRATLAGYYRG